MKNKCPKCGSGYMQKRPSAPDTDWVCAKCNEPVNFNTPNNCVHWTAEQSPKISRLRVLVVSVQSRRQ